MGLLLKRIQTGGQAGLVTRGGIFVDYALLYGLVQPGNGRPKCLFGGLFLALGEALAQIAQSGAQPGTIGSVSEAAFFGLPCAFQRGKVIRHEIFLPSSQVDLSGDVKVDRRELLINDSTVASYGGQLSGCFGQYDKRLREA